MLKRHLPVLIALTVLALIGYLVVHPPGSKPSAVTPPPAPRDPKTAAEHCFLQDAKVAPDGSVSFQAIFSNASLDRIAPSGTIDVSVIHTEGWHRSPEEKAAKPIPDETIVCTMKAEVGPGSYVDASQASVTGRFDKSCPTAAMPGRFVMLRGHLTQSDGSALCEYSGEIPAALGGEDKTAETLEGDLHRRAAADAGAASELEAIRAYLETLPRALAAIDPTQAPKETSCGARATGEAPRFMYDRLKGLVPRDAGTRDAPVSFVPRGLSRESVVADGLFDAYDAPTPRIVEIGTKVKALGDFIIVYVPLEYVAPEVSMPDSTASKQEGRFTSGRYRGAMFIVDRVQGKLACAGSYSAVNRKTEVKSKQANEIHRLVDADLAGEASDAAGALLKRIAPGLRVAEVEAM